MSRMGMVGALKPLHLSLKLLGLAPYRLGESECRASRLADCWSLAVLLCVTGLSVAALILEPVGDLYLDIKSNFIEEIADTLEAITSVLAMVICLLFNFVNRKKLLRALNKILKLDADLGPTEVAPDNAMSVALAVAGLLVTYVLFTANVVLEVVNFAGVETPLQITVYVTPSLVTGHVALQFVALLGALRRRFAALNTHYELNRDYWNDFGSKDRVEKFAPMKLPNPKRYIYENLQRRAEFVRRCHWDLCETVAEVNGAFSPQVLAIMVQSVVTLISTAFYLASEFLTKGERVPLQMHFYTAVICVFCSIQVFSIIIASVLISIESHRTGQIMFKKEFHLLRYKEFEHEVFFSVQLIHQNVQIEVCKGLPITGTMLTTILGLMTTYLLIVIQFDVSIMHPHIPQ